MGAATEMTNPVCGDWVSLQTVIVDGTLERFRYDVKGCWPVQGCLEFLGDRWLGEAVSSLVAWPLGDFLASISGVPTSKRHAFSLTHRALVTSVLSKTEYSQLFGNKAKERV